MKIFKARRVFYAILALAVLATSAQCKETKGQVSLLMFSEKIISHINNQRFDEASALFHYPSGYSQQEVESDRLDVGIALKSLSEIFGRIENHELLDGNIDVINVQIGGGTIDFWANYNQLLLIVMGVEFSNYTEGFLTFAFCKINNKYVLKEIRYGLPKSSPNALKQISTAIKTISSVLSSEN